MKNKDIFANRFKPATYDKKNLISFERKNIWMNGIEKHSNPSNRGFVVFLGVCVLITCYFVGSAIFRN